ncbi:MAG TPA: sugar phosphate isomerase/epimerase [Clostridia bacterium]|nr:sugar phosphate isomerase/epimerase [Clostridia bacterium]
MKSTDDISMLLSEIKERGMELGIHFPLRAGIYSSRDPLFLDPDTDVRKSAFRDIESELEFIGSLGIKPRYVLFHYPKPVIIPERFDLSRWRFYQRSEYVYESEYSFDKLVKYSRDLLEWLSCKADEYGFMPILELDALNGYITGTSFLEGLLSEFGDVRLCLDIGRLHVQDRIDTCFNAAEVLKKFLKYTGLLHLSNTKVGKTLELAHFPLLPGLKPEDGWADVDGYFKLIRQENRDVKLFFEHRSDLISDVELDSCYNWIDRLLNTEY